MISSRLEPRSMSSLRGDFGCGGSDPCDLVVGPNPWWLGASLYYSLLAQKSSHPKYGMILNKASSGREGDTGRHVVREALGLARRRPGNARYWSARPANRAPRSIRATQLNPHSPHIPRSAPLILFAHPFSNTRAPQPPCPRTNTYFTSHYMLHVIQWRNFTYTLQ